jgi:amino acid permease
MAILYPVSGGFYTLASRMLDPSFAFAMGWNYVLQWAVVLPLEIVSVILYRHGRWANLAWYAMRSPCLPAAAATTTHPTWLAVMSAPFIVTTC